jgi:hypothetical protein
MGISYEPHDIYFFQVQLQSRFYLLQAKLLAGNLKLNNEQLINGDEADISCEEPIHFEFSCKPLSLYSVK